MINRELMQKYDVPAPRYTSYPTVPYWEDSPSSERWMQEIDSAFRNCNNGWALYMHIPFCESLCTFCGCNTSITKNHSVESPYVENLLQEFHAYREQTQNFNNVPLREIHLGGGTPTFLSATSLQQLIQPIMDNVIRDPEHFVGAIEVDPRRVNWDQLEVLSNLGFRRISLGVQDFSEKVQSLINRVQPRAMTESTIKMAREIGYNSINFDLIYGLPAQTPESIRQMVETTIELRPDRIALYSFALVPWIKAQQRLFKEADLPKGEAKRELYEISKSMLLEAGYKELGMDHFALPEDSLYKAAQAKKMHRNFMGYTEQRTDILVGLGVSSISETPTCFHQNEKVLPVYQRRVSEREIPTFRGHLLNEEDRSQREKILELMTCLETDISDEQEVNDLKDYLHMMIQDDIVVFEGKTLRIREEGKAFLRNACMGLDLRLRRKTPDKKVFSQSL